jgi:hypothetical protein
MTLDNQEALVEQGTEVLIWNWTLSQRRNVTATTEFKK